MLTTVPRRLRTEESGFSLIELLVAMAIGSIVLTALMKIFLGGITTTTMVNDRVEAAGRARLAMDRVVTLLNSQTCLYASNGTSNPPITSGQDNDITFYANLGAVNADPMRYRLRYDAATKRIFEDRYVPTKDATGNLVFAAAPSTSRVMATGIVPETAGAPLFRFWQFVTTAGAAYGTVDPTPLPAAAGLSSAGRFSAVRVTVAFSAQPERTKTTDPRATSVQGSATVGSADASDPLKGVNC